MKLKDLCDMMNYNLSRKQTGKSNLADIEKAITELFFKKNDLTDEQIRNFETNLYTNPNMFDKTINYDGLETVKEYFNDGLKNYKNLENGKSL